LTYFNIRRGGPHGQQTNRLTWQISGFQAAHSALVAVLAFKNLRGSLTVPPVDSILWIQEFSKGAKWFWGQNSSLGISICCAA